MVRRGVQPGIPGRPPKDPKTRIGIPARALVTDPVRAALVELSDELSIPLPKYGVIPSDIVRLGLWLVIDQYAKKGELRDDPSFESLRQLGLV